ncbi:pimeloyl-ACP methyl ester carboxylesterase [Nakamurella sp. UYEF19]|uniref:alpha/beta hydrolase n=1 Tax=Nakamurella sp. UYEF19 TaxID=1756392 RepID=UPI00339AB3B1
MSITSWPSVDTLTVNGIQIAYQSFGEPADIPVLLVMGLGTQMLAWPDDFCIGLAQQGHHVVRYDNRDVGLSTHFDTAPAQPFRSLFGLAKPAYRLVDMARDAVGLIEALGWESCHLVGVSMGGMIAQNVVLLRPDLVRSLVSMSSTTGSLLVGKPRPDVLASMLVARPAADREEAVNNSMAMYRRIRSIGFPAEEDRIRAIAGVAYDRRYDPAGGTRQFSAILAAPDRTTALKRVSVPTLVIHGTNDPLVNLTGGLATAASIPGSRLVTIAGMGHDLPSPLWPQFVDEIGITVAAGEGG